MNSVLPDNTQHPYLGPLRVMKGAAVCRVSANVMLLLAGFQDDAGNCFLHLEASYYTLIFESLTVTVRTTMFNIKKLQVLPTQCICVSFGSQSSNFPIHH